MKNLSIMTMTLVAVLAASTAFADDHGGNNQPSTTAGSLGGFVAGAGSFSGSSAFTGSTGNGTATSQNFSGASNFATVGFSQSPAGGTINTNTGGTSSAGSQTTQAGSSFAAGTAFGTGAAFAAGGLAGFGTTGFGSHQGW